MTNGPIIEHDKSEPKIDRGPGPWRWVFPVLLVGVAINAFTRGVDWISFAGGLALGCTLAGWAIEVTNNKVPESWKSRRSPRNTNSDF